MLYDTIFDVAQTAHLGWRLAAPAAVAALCAVYPAFFRKGSKLVRAVALAVIGLSAFAAFTLYRYADLQRADFIRILAAGEARIAEGTVEGRRRDGRTEMFTVGGVPFSYDTAVPTHAYHEKGGPEHGGARLRVHYAGFTDYRPILRIEREAGS